MGPEPTRRPRKGNLADRAATRLKDGILRGQYPMGEPLRELELCSALGISRIPLREALHRLEGEGLVEIRPNRGAVVARLTEAEIIEIAEICRLVEGNLLVHAVPGVGREALEKAEAFLELLDEVDDLVEWARINWKFHATIYGPANRPLQVGLVGSLRERAERAMFMLIADKKRRLSLNREHRAILAAMRARRAKLAARLLEEHLRGGKEEVLRLIARS